MWWTEQGKRTLTRADRELFVRMACSLWEDLELELEDPGYNVPTGIAAFDRLSVQQRFVVLAEITAGLLDRKVPQVPLTQANEAAIAAVYHVGTSELIDCDRYPDFRHLVRAAARQNEMPALPGLRAPVSEYTWYIQQLRELVLWDTDFALDGAAMDLPADQSRALHTEMGIDTECFAAVVPDPRDVAAHRAVLEKYLGGRTRCYAPRRRTGKTSPGRRKSRRGCRQTQVMNSKAGTACSWTSDRGGTRGPLIGDRVPEIRDHT